MITKTERDKLRRLSSEGSPGSWRVTSYVDAGDGRGIVATGSPDITHIRISTPVVVGVHGSRYISAKQRDNDARLIVVMRNQLVQLLDALDAAELEIKQLKDGT